MPLSRQKTRFENLHEIGPGTFANLVDRRRLALPYSTNFSG
jgi:hypothetical protein